MLLIFSSIVHLILLLLLSFPILWVLYVIFAIKYERISHNLARLAKQNILLENLNNYLLNNYLI
jgi:hypothetical protein